MNVTEGLKDVINSKIEDIIRDWSQTGRGFHVHFSTDETVPLEQGRFLGRGAVGDVYETTIKGQKLAWKKIMFRRKIDQIEKKEIEILKKVSHAHLIQLVGTYTHGRSLGILMYPVAVCDLHTFFEDVEAHWTEGSSDAVQQARLEALGYIPNMAAKALPIFTKIGCLVSAVAYLHDNKIRHKDLKPSNILLSRDGLWLSDFGSATDFSLLSQSATDNERGTPRYWAPEMAAWEPSGRAADIFTLGCVLLEIFVLQETGTLEHLRQHRSAKNPLFHSNLERTNEWFSIFQTPDARQNHLLWETRAMLSRQPEKRPLTTDILTRMKACDGWAEPSTFGRCCKTRNITTQEYTKLVSDSIMEQHHLEERHRLQTEVCDYKRENDSLRAQLYTARSALKLRDDMISELEGPLTFLRQELSKADNAKHVLHVGAEADEQEHAAKQNHALSSGSRDSITPVIELPPQPSISIYDAKTKVWSQVGTSLPKTI